MDRVHQTATSHRQSVELQQERHDLAEREPELFIEHHDERDHLRTKLRGGGTERVRCLQMMTALHATAASVAASHMNVELPDHDARDRQLFLILGGDARVHHGTGTARAVRRERDVVTLVHVQRTAPTRLWSIGTASLSPGSLRMFLQRLRKGRRLPESRPSRVVELSFQVIDLMAEPFCFALKLVALISQRIAFALGLLGTFAPVGTVRSAIRVVQLRRFRHALLSRTLIH